jgi:uncharacterized protein (DUF488 family)
LMCYERNPQECHRTIVASALTNARLKVEHLGVREGLASREHGHTKTGKGTRPR